MTTLYQTRHLIPAGQWLKNSFPGGGGGQGVCGRVGDPIHPFRAYQPLIFQLHPTQNFSGTEAACYTCMDGQLLPLSVISRFHRKCEPVTESGCWIWTGELNQYGYGRLSIGSKRFGAHRLSYEVHKAPVPPETYVCHTCDVRSCVNPHHLFLGTQLENVADMDRKGRRRWTRPTAHSQARLTDEVVREIRAAPRSETNASLARRFGVSATTISEVRRGLRWHHVALSSGLTQ